MYFCLNQDPFASLHAFAATQFSGYGYWCPIPYTQMISGNGNMMLVRNKELNGIVGLAEFYSHGPSHKL